MKFSIIFLFCVIAALNTANSDPLNNTKHEVLLQRLRRQTQQSVNQDLCAIFGVCDGQSGGDLNQDVVLTERPQRPQRPTSTRRPDVVLTDRPNRPGRPIPTRPPTESIPTRPPQQPIPTEEPTSTITTVLGEEQYSRCINMCQRIASYNPVCGSDGVTYDNSGKLRCAASCGRPNVTQTRLGPC